MALVDTKEITNIVSLVHEFEPQIIMFYVQKAPLLAQWLMHISKPRFHNKQSL